jgi:sarcosine oxidase subunit alpha
MSGGAHRRAEGGAIDRARPVRFQFNGRPYSGFVGDTLASALLANGVHLVGRSFKYHRPRGIQGAGYEDASAVVQLVGDEDAPNVLATSLRLREGLSAKSINCWPGPGFDLAAVLQAASRIIPAGFYYKTFKWPHWHWFEPYIRRAAGLSRGSATGSPNLVYENRYDHCDVLVVGAGPAGLMAAVVAARSGLRVVLADDGIAPGGRLRSESTRIEGKPALVWVQAMIDELDSYPNVLRLQDATVWGYHEGNFLTIVERRPDNSRIHQRNRKLWAKQVVLATGAIERPIVFANNDRPGVMLASAVRTYLNAYAVIPGRRAVIFTNNDSAYETAFDLHDAGIDVAAVVDTRARVSSAISERLATLGIPHLIDHVIHDTRGRLRVKRVGVRPRNGGVGHAFDCDLVAVSGGWNPAVHLFSQSRAKLRYETELATLVPCEAWQETQVAGAAAGKFRLADCLRDGASAGVEAANRAGGAAEPPPRPATEPEAEYAISPCWVVDGDAEANAKSFIDMIGDVTVADIRLALREGYESIEHVKRYTTAGMGLDQGKMGNLNVIGLVAETLGRALGDIGATTFRSPYTPVEFGAIAGNRPGPFILPARRTPMTEWHETAGAKMYEAGARWQRPGYYPQPGESMQDAIERESRAVRESVGIYDGSPLGKFEIKGPDAVRLLDLAYTNAWGSLALNHGRYGVMLTDDGLMSDDSVTFRLGADRYLMMSATGNADQTYARLERMIQVERPDLKVLITPLTSQWANATVCGPKARDVLRRAGTDIDLAGDSFPFMAVREGVLAGLPVRIFRVSYTGELSFEVNTPSRHGAELWQRLIDGGADFGICPVGSEANHVLRIEKGFLSFGHEVDGTVDPFDLGMAWVVSKQKSDFIGKRAMEIRRRGEPCRRELVGLLSDDPEVTIPEGAPLTPRGDRCDSEGFVSASVRSVANNRSIALALLDNGRARMGETVHARLPERVIRATVTAPVFYDPDGSRMRS